MHVAFEDKNCTVIDNFLDRDAFAALTTGVQFLDFRTIHDTKWNKPYGQPGLPIIQTEGVIRGERDVTPERLDLLGSFVDRLRGETRLPTTGPASAIFESKILSGKLVAMGVGAGLEWHADTDQVSGAYIFYAHPVWNSSWGGELFVLDGETTMGMDRNSDEGSSSSSHETRGALVGPDFFTTGAEEHRLEVGHGRFFAARPNRLIVINGAVEHRVNPVLPAAGDRYRCSIVGFAIK